MKIDGANFFLIHVVIYSVNHFIIYMCAISFDCAKTRNLTIRFFFLRLYQYIIVGSPICITQIENQL